MNNTAAKLQLNSTQIPNYLIDVVMPQVSPTEFKILMIIARQTYGWHKESDRIAYSLLIAKTGSSNGSIATSLRTLREKGFIEVTDKNGNIILTKDEARGKDLYYRISVKTPKIGVDLSRNRTPKIGDTKETNTKTSTNVEGGVKKTPACPLTNGSPFREKWTNGHQECVEYLISSEETRNYKFTNRAKQFNFIHKMLRAGVGFDKMDKTIGLVEKKYGKNNWDFATLANWMDKGGGSA